MRKALKWIGIGLGGLVLLLLIAGSAMYVVGGSKLKKTYDVPETALTVVSDSAALARGEHLTRTMGCQDCHTPTLAGTVMIDAPPFRVVSSNLTPAGVGASYSDVDFERAIRHGVRPNGTALLVMPSLAYHSMADEDVASIIAYIRSLDPVKADLPATEVRAVGRIMAAGPLDPGFEVNVAPSPASRPPIGATAAYGGYLFNTTCAYCHGADGQGLAQPPGPPGMIPSPSFAAAARWSLDEFKQTLRTGVTPGGRALNQEYMPWQFTAHMTDDELEALHLYLRSLMGVEPRPTAANS